MPSTQILRPATDAERAEMRRQLDALPLRAGPISNAALAWVLTLAAWLALWLLLAWIGRQLVALETDFRPRHAVWIGAGGAVVLAILAIRASARSLKGVDARRARLDQDVAAGEVFEENLVLTGAKCFVEPEHGMRIFLLRTDTGRVLTLYDHDSIDPAVAPAAAAVAPLTPRVQLRLVQAAVSHWLIGPATFEGELLSVGEPIELQVDPKDWPEDEEDCLIPWDELEARLGGRQVAQV